MKQTKNNNNNSINSKEHRRNHEEQNNIRTKIIENKSWSEKDLGVWKKKRLLRRWIILHYVDKLQWHIATYLSKIILIFYT